MTKAVVYAQYKDTMVIDYSIESQIMCCVEYAEKNNIEIVNIYTDKAKNVNDRLDFRKMIKDSYKGEFDTVLVWAIDRFARNTKEAERNFDILSNNNVRVIFTKDAFDDTPSPEFLRVICDSLEKEIREKHRR